MYAVSQQLALIAVFKSGSSNISSIIFIQHNSGSIPSGGHDRLLPTVPINGSVNDSIPGLSKSDVKRSSASPTQVWYLKNLYLILLILPMDI